MLNSLLHLRTLHSFVILTEELNFSRAAQRLNIAQPALSQQIKQLEERVGVTLFERAERPLRLTEAGQYFRVEAQQILLNYANSLSIARQIGQGRKGWFGIGFTRSAMYSLLPAALASFTKTYPEVELKLHELFTEQQAEALRDRRIHIGIARDPSDVPDLQRCLLIEEALYVVLPQSHLKARAPRLKPDDLAHEPVILFPNYPNARFPDLILSIYAQAGVIPQIAFRAFEIQTALGLVAANLGITFVAASVARHPREGLVYVPLLTEGIPRTTSLFALFRQDDPSEHLQSMRRILERERDRYVTTP